MSGKNKTLVIIGILIAFTLILVFITLTDVSAEKPKKTELSGAELWSQNCGRCHNYRSIHEFNDPQWDIIVNHMRVVGNIPGDQSKAILKFLQDTNNPPQDEVVTKKPAKVEEGREEVLKGDVANGKEIYDSNCVSCHGIAGKGNGPAAASLTPKPRDLTDEQYMKTLTDDHLFKVISEGGASVGKSPLMPAWGTTLKEEDIINVISYIRSLSQKEMIKP